MQATYGAISVFCLMAFCALMAWIYTIANKNELKQMNDEIYKQSAYVCNEEKATPPSRTQTYYNRIHGILNELPENNHQSMKDDLINEATETYLEIQELEESINQAI